MESLEKMVKKSTLDKHKHQRQRKIDPLKRNSKKRVERSHICSTCQMSFPWLYHLKRHMQTHNENKTFTCTECNFSTTIFSKYRKHMQTHNKKARATKRYETNCNDLAVKTSRSTKAVNVSKQKSSLNITKKNFQAMAKPPFVMNLINNICILNRALRMRQKRTVQSMSTFGAQKRPKREGKGRKKKIDPEDDFKF